MSDGEKGGSERVSWTKQIVLALAVLGFGLVIAGRACVLQDETTGEPASTTQEAGDNS
ncbi:MAG: hypothetical protein P8Q36_12095 [Alphaproteobacteria bacterium]|jgi:hypothetical protein|nr:hypothetical protein [Rhodospirillaceae bacterium]MBT6509952.1 hypothetical protein [Rhodospirillaceae bacterium]MBT7613955.1 hypothetical protein [Rhodospirillaceae bacterium]MBT7645585.1 hypothetical protein [Rhodospirillaceae bacterium]MDG2481592.1 hypothetical protein [Alphaproteobacteria bacterium]